MPANVETMFYTREKPWHGLGTMVTEAPTSRDALDLAGLDWEVIQKDLITTDGIPVSGFKANIRNWDRQVLGVVTDRYKVVQNEEAFAFTDALLGEGITYETAGSLQNGRRTWILAKMPHKYIINGGRDYALFSVYELPRRIRSNQGCHDSCTGSLPEHLKPCPRHGKAELVYRPCRRYPR